MSDDPENAFPEAEAALRSWLAAQGAAGVTIVRSHEPPRADPVSGKFKHVLRDIT